MNDVSSAMLPESRDFIRQIVADDLAAGRHAVIVTRFPPEPNGYLHIGHAKSICLNFGVAAETGGRCYLRLDDTNPVREDQAFVDAIIDCVRWLGFDWGDRLTHASDYFGRIHGCAVALIEAGKAYVDSLTQEQMREYRGTLTAPGRASPHRDRTVAENLDLFARMKSGEFADGQHVLRAKIDMASPNINMRDPVLYRIRRATHQRTGDAWCIYPMYDFAHTISDALEGITHSLCTLEFEDHRPLYDWCVEQLDLPGRPQQIEFAKLQFTYTLLSKRRLLELVQSGKVAGWDDPRMPTLRGMRRRGYTPEALRDLCERVGVSKRNATIDVTLLEHHVREHLNATSPRVMGILHPMKVVLTNVPEGEVTWIEQAEYFKDEPARGSRRVPLTRTLLIEREDFKEVPVKGWWRLSPGLAVRLRHAGSVIRCDEVIKDVSGEVSELRCTLIHSDSSPGTVGFFMISLTITSPAWVGAVRPLAQRPR